MTVQSTSFPTATASPRLFTPPQCRTFLAVTVNRNRSSTLPIRPNHNRVTSSLRSPPGHCASNHDCQILPHRYASCSAPSFCNRVDKSFPTLPHLFMPVRFFPIPSLPILPCVTNTHPANPQPLRPLQSATAHTIPITLNLFSAIHYCQILSNQFRPFLFFSFSYRPILYSSFGA